MQARPGRRGKLGREARTRQGGYQQRSAPGKTEQRSAHGPRPRQRARPPALVVARQAAASQAAKRDNQACEHQAALEPRQPESWYGEPSCRANSWHWSLDDWIWAADSAPPDSSVSYA